MRRRLLARLLAPALAALAALLLTAPAALAESAPSELLAPVVKGTPRDESRISTTRGKWESAAPLTFAYEWLRCNSAGEECAAIEGATQATYKLTHEDVGHRIRSTVTAKNEGGGEKATSLPSAVIAAVAPRKAARPVISGTPQDGQLVTAGDGTWKGTPPFTYSYQWEACTKVGTTLECKPIPGATEKTYRARTADIGDKLRTLVTAKNNVGSASNLSGMTTAKVIAGPPVETAAPSISGTPLDGQTLTAEPGTWAGTGPFMFSYQWKSCTILTGECNPIPGASGPTYTAGPLDVASSLEVVVTAKNTLGSASATSPQTNAVSALLPKNTELPSIAGELLDGQLLKALTGAWSGTEPLSFAYEWLACNSAGEACHTISEAIAPALSLVSSLVGETVRVAVTATNTAGSTTALSPATTPVAALLPSDKSLPQVVGSLIDGQLLSALTGSWSGSTPLEYAYQWQECDAKGEACKNIEGETGTALKLISALVGQTVRLAVTATNSGGSQTAYSEPTGIIAALLPSNTTLPSIAGSLLDGQLLSGAIGAWTGSTPLKYAYQWQECNSKGEACKNIEGETGAALKLISALVGQTVRLAVTATNSGGSQTAYSEPTGVIAALLPSNGTLPSITGSLIDGQLLSGAIGAWTGSTPLKYAYQWQECNSKGEGCKNIEGETGAALKLISALVGQTVRLAVTATNSGGSQTAYSEPTGVIAALLPSDTTLPSIAGSLIDGQLLTGAIGAWTGSTPLKYAYQWQECNAKGEGCKNIEGETGTALKLISALVGQTVRLAVTATNSGGSQTAYSEPTGIIAALLPSNGTLPSIGGLAEDGQKLTGAIGSWTGSTPLKYAYQWEQCNSSGGECKALGGETNETLGVVSNLVKSTVRLVVTATNSGGSTQATSAATSPVLAALPVNAVLPTISGILKLGEKLLARHETWNGTAPITYSYQWQLCGALGLVGECKNITGATGENLLLELLDVGLTLRVGVTAHNERGASETVYTKVTGLIQGLGLAPSKGAAGTDIVLKGSGVSSAQTVNFGSTAVEPEVKSANEIVATAPEGSGTVPVTVSTAEGTTHETPGTQFTYSP